jgi:hypothetical protein
VQFRRGQKAKLRIPVQAVTPFAGGEQRKGGKGKGGRLRSDTLRRAFNSPFWPHVLCTTSVGQEGAGLPSVVRADRALGPAERSRRF